MRVLLAMSGGVDSSVAAALLHRQGHEVIGLFMRTGVHQPESKESNYQIPTTTRHRGCCSAVDSNDARRVADLLNMPFYAVDFEEDFGRIIDYFADEYLAGRTPNPCVECNNWLKFGKLWHFAHSVDAQAVATGHYARCEDGSLFRAIDINKDQSYVLFGLKRDMLSRVLFPIGGLRKHQVRELARDFGLPVSEKPDSVEICFVPDGDHSSLIRRRRPDRETAGVFVDSAGQVMGTHDGYERFTVGQRKGLGVATGSRRYVLEIIPESRQVVLGDVQDTLGNGLLANSNNWLIQPPTGEVHCSAKIRYRHTPAPAIVRPVGDGVEVHFNEPQSAITPGQAVVFYDGERVLGGGWIDRPLN